MCHTKNKEMADLLLMIMHLIYGHYTVMYKKWYEFSEDIKSRSRFFPKSPLLDRIKNISDFAKMDLNQGTVLYRARLYKSEYEFAQKELKDILESLKKQFPNERLTEDDLHNVGRLAFLQEMEGNNIYKRITELKGNTRYFGYDEMGSDAPKLVMSSGRANAKNIPFLYTSEDIETALMEVQPKLGQKASIAEVHLNRPICLFNFFSDISKDENDKYGIAMDLEVLSTCFSRPNFKDDFEYLPTQYLCEYIRELGFDGIRFGSSVKHGGINVIIFDTDDLTKPYSITDTKVFEMNDFKIGYKLILPFQQ